MAAFEQSSEVPVPEAEQTKQEKAIPEEFIPESIQQEIQQANPLEQMGVDPAAVQQQVQQATQNIQAQAPDWIEQNIQTPVGAWMRGRSIEEEQAWRDEEKAKVAEADEAMRQSKDPVAELIRAGMAGTMDGWDSVVNTANLGGDTVKKGINQMLGRPIDPTQDPDSPEYQNRDVDWFDIPEEWKPENQTGWGKFGRGLVEFGLLTRWVGQLGGPGMGGLRSANQFGAGNRYIQFINRGGRIFAEGSVAEMISNSSETGNLVNLAEQFIPQYTPDLIKGLATRPEDNPYLNKVKTAAVGGGANWFGAFIGAFAKGMWRYIDDIKVGKTVTEATENANQTYQLDFFESLEADEKAAIQMGVDDRINGNSLGDRGLSNQDARDYFDSKYLDEDDYAALIDPNTSDADKLALQRLADKIGESKGDSFDIINQKSKLQPKEKPTPFVNPELYSPPERATLRVEPDSGKQSLLESVLDLKRGGDGRSYTPYASETSIRTVARGSKPFREFVEEVLGDITDKSFREFDNRLSVEEITKLIRAQAAPMIDLVEEFSQGKSVGNIAKRFEEMLKDPQRYRVYSEGPDFKVQTISPTQKGANLLVLHALARTVSDISNGALSISNHMPIQRQGEMVLDAMKVLFVENKKMGMMWGLDGRIQQPDFILPKTVKELAEKRLKVTQIETEEYFNALHGLFKNERWEELRDLMELHMLSDGHVRTLTHIHEFLRGKLKGGRMDDVHIKGKARQLLQGTFFNSILGAPRTIRKAVLGTNTLAMMRPVQALVGARLPWINIDEKQAAVAVAQLDSIGRAWSESWNMAKRNWELGASKKNQDYLSKFEVEADLREWKSLRRHYEKYSESTMIGEKSYPTQLAAYEFMDKIVDFNMSPWVKYSQNAMGAGDAFARTIIGRQRMAMKAGLKAIEDNPNINVKDIRKVVADTEDNFRKEIFEKNGDGFWIVKDKAAAMAGDEAAMTRSLQENFEGFEAIARIPGMKVFFPLVRPGFNFLDIVFQHTPAMHMRDKFYDLVERPRKTGEAVSQRLLDKYGLQANEVSQEVALIEGRIATGTAVIGMGALAASQGRLTGSMPHDKELRDLWKANNIQPNSFVFGDLEKNPIYVPFIDNMLMPEVFAPLMTMTANAFAYQDVLGEKTTDETFEKLRWMAASLIVDQSMLSGAGDLAALMDPYSSGGSKVEYVLSRTVRSHAPFSAILGELGNVIDSTQKEANTLWEMIIKRDAIAKSFVASKYDVLSKDRSGKRLVYGPENPLIKIFNFGSFIPVVPVDGDPVRQTLKDIRFNMPEELSKIDGVDLNSKEMSELQKILSMTGPNGEDLRKDLEYVISTNEFKSSLKSYKDTGRKITDGYDLKDATFYLMVRDVFTKHKQRAKWQLINDPKFAELAKRINAAIAKKQMLKSNTVTPANIREVEQMERLKNYATKP